MCVCVYEYILYIFFNSYKFSVFFQIIFYDITIYSRCMHIIKYYFVFTIDKISTMTYLYLYSDSVTCRLFYCVVIFSRLCGIMYTVLTAEMNKNKSKYHCAAVAVRSGKTYRTYKKWTVPLNVYCRIPIVKYAKSRVRFYRREKKSPYSFE